MQSVRVGVKGVLAQVKGIGRQYGMDLDLGACAFPRHGVRELGRVLMAGGEGFDLISLGVETHEKRVEGVRRVEVFEGRDECLSAVWKTVIDHWDVVFVVGLNVAHFIRFFGSIDGHGVILFGDGEGWRTI